MINLSSCERLERGFDKTSASIDFDIVIRVGALDDASSPGEGESNNANGTSASSWLNYPQFLMYIRTEDTIPAITSAMIARNPL